MVENLIYSVAGLVIGFVMGWWLRCYKKGQVSPLNMRRHRDEEHSRPRGDVGYVPGAPIPTVIPSVRFDPTTGEPLIAREQVQRPSPVPRSIAIILILLAAGSIAYLFWQEGQNSTRISQANTALTDEVHKNSALLQQLSHQQVVIDGNEQRLEELVLAISTAKTPGEVTEAIQRFLKQSGDARAKEKKYQQGGGKVTGSSAPLGDTKGSASPQAQSSPRPQPSPAASQAPAPSPSPSPAPKPSPTPTSGPVYVCIVTPLGRVCEPKGAADQNVVILTS